MPGAPTIGTATAGNAQATVTFTPASDGGSPITGYTVTSSPGSITATGTASPIAVTGLTNGTAYTFTVTATNAIGTGAASATSNSVTPALSTALTPPAPGKGDLVDGTSSASPSGTATAGVTGLSVSGSGVGALTVATYSGSPVVGTVSGGTGAYYDVAISSGNSFSSLTITITDLGPGGQSIDWWNGTAWVPFSNQTFDPATDSVTAVVDRDDVADLGPVDRDPGCGVDQPDARAGLLAGGVGRRGLRLR